MKKEKEREKGSNREKKERERGREDTITLSFSISVSLSLSSLSLSLSLSLYLYLSLDWFIIELCHWKHSEWIFSTIDGFDGSIYCYIRREWRTSTTASVAFSKKSFKNNHLSSPFLQFFSTSFITTSSPAFYV
jgi:hypothetical protein